MIDACVLYPTVMREVVLGCARAGLFEARWSARILEEWARSAGKRGETEEVIARGEIAALAAHFPYGLVQYDTGLERRYWLPDENDIHVLTAAISGSCDAILTQNAKDFPRNVLAEEGLERRDPDGFIMALFAQDEAAVTAVGDAVLLEARRLSGQDWSIRALMKKARLPRLGKALSQKF